MSAVMTTGKSDNSPRGAGKKQMDRLLLYVTRLCVYFAAGDYVHHTFSINHFLLADRGIHNRGKRLSTVSNLLSRLRLTRFCLNILRRC